MKKLKVTVFVLIILFSFLLPGKSFANVVSVLLSDNANAVQISGTDFVLTTGDSMCTPEFTGSFVLNYRAGEVYCGDVQYILPVTLTSNNPISINGLNYKGSITLEEKDGKLCLVNCVDVEDYLAGVLACEMSPKWPLEALKAQAVLARTYLQNQGQKHGKYTICNSEHCQVYKGIPKHCDTIAKALAETQGTLLYYNNVPAQVFYFADSGGVTASSKDVWGREVIPYLISKPDPDVISQKFLTWKFRCNTALLREKLLSKGIDVGTILSITPTVVDESGRVKQLEVKGESGTRNIPVSLFRSLFGINKIKSTLFKIETQGSMDNDVQQASSPLKTQQETQQVVNVKKTTKRPNQKFNSKVDELTWLSEQGAYTTQELYAILGDFDNYDSYIKNGYEILKTGKKPLTKAPDTFVTNPKESEQVQSYTVNGAVIGEEFVITGYGYGHGVGMPQNQCKYLAQAGWTYDQILAYYFPGTVLTKGDAK